MSPRPVDYWHTIVWPVAVAILVITVVLVVVALIETQH